MKAMHTHSTRRLRAWSTALALLLLSTAPTVQAQDPQAQIPEQAQSLFDDAVADYMAKRWDQAALKFRKAYAVLPDALFLYNQAKALQKLENYQAAIGALTRARDQKERPLPPDIVAKVPAFLAELETSLALEETQEKEAAVAAEVVAPIGPPPGNQDIQEEGRFGEIGWSGVAVGGAGLGLVIWSALLADSVTSESAALLEEQDTGRFQQQRDDIQSDQDLAQILLFSGAGLLTVGSVPVWRQHAMGMT